MPLEASPVKPAETRHFVRYGFYAVENAFRRLPKARRAAARKSFLKLLESWDKKIQLYPYSTAGTRPDADFMLWSVSPRLADLRDLALDIRRSDIGAYLTTPHAYLAMTRKSMYVDQHRHPGQEGHSLQIESNGSKFLFVYPFVKTHAWYQCSMEDRQKMMTEHIEAGHRFPSVKIHTTYSYGLDDQEFVVAFESDHPGDFVDLVMALRTGRARPYTERDTPIFTCVRTPLEKLVEEL